MKQAFTYLLLLALSVCGKQAYELFAPGESIRSNPSGALSDIADEVIAIPLQSPEAHPIKEARHIRQEGNDLFLISEETLYRFNRVGRIYLPRHPSGRHTGGGICSEPRQPATDRIGKHGRYFLLLVQRRPPNPEKAKKRPPGEQAPTIHIHARQPDTHYRGTRPNGRYGRASRHDREANRRVRSLLPPIAVSHGAADRLGASRMPDQFSLPGSGRGTASGAVYAYAPSFQPENLLRDTLYIRQKRQSQALESLAGGDALPLLPVRMGSRFWVSAYYDAEDKSKNYTFCYDTEKERYWQVKDGLKDNFYQTGNVRRMEPIDPYSQAYCFCKAGADIRGLFPEQARAEGLVLFIVRLKG